MGGPSEIRVDRRYDEAHFCATVQRVSYSHLDILQRDFNNEPPEGRSAIISMKFMESGSFECLSGKQVVRSVPLGRVVLSGFGIWVKLECEAWSWLIDASAVSQHQSHEEKTADLLVGSDYHGRTLPDVLLSRVVGQ